MDHEPLPESASRLLDGADEPHWPVAHVGVLVPWANTVMEAELPVLGRTRVVWHYSRLVPDGRTTALDDGFLAGLVHAIPAALHQLSELPLSSVAVGCTSAGFRFPDDAQAVLADAGAPAFTAFDALISTLGRMAASRIALLAPYPAELTSREAAAFEAAGIEVPVCGSLGLRDRFAAIGTDEIVAMLAHPGSAAVRGVEAVVLSCTAWPTLAAARSLEQQFGLPVVSSNIAVAAHAASLTSAADLP